MYSLGGPPGEPGPQAFLQLSLGQHRKLPGGFLIEPVAVEEQSDPAAGLAFRPGLTKPGSLLQED
jgi:hypothetical protein